MIRSSASWLFFCILWSLFTSQVAHAAAAGFWQAVVLGLLLYATPTLIILAHRFELYNKWIEEDLK